MSLELPTLEVVSDIVPNPVFARGEQQHLPLQTKRVSQDRLKGSISAQCVQSGCPIAALVAAARAEKASKLL